MLAEALATCNAHLQVFFQKLEWDQCEIGLKVLKMLEREREVQNGTCRIIVLFSWIAELT